MVKRVVVLNEEVQELGRQLPDLIHMIKGMLGVCMAEVPAFDQMETEGVRLSWRARLKDGRVVTFELVEGEGEGDDHVITLQHSPRCVGNPLLPTLQVQREDGEFVVTTCDGD